jgi:long-chain acyl-CoA synthetase
MAETFPQHLLEKAHQYGHRKTALREKEFGVWQALSWAEYLEHVRYFSLGLVSLGLQPGESVGVIGDNRPEWLYAELAAQSAGAASLGIYQDSNPEEVCYIADYGDASFLVVEDQEQVDKALAVIDRLPRVRKIIYHDPRGLRSYDESILMGLPVVEELGRAYESQHPGCFEEMVARGRGDDIAVLAATSGTTSRPKIAMLSHANMLSQAANLMQVDPISADADFVSFLPLAWIGEQMISVSCGLYAGFILNFPEEPETVQENICEIGPDIIFAPPRIWENMLSGVQVKMEDASRLKRVMFNWALANGYKMADASFRKEKPSWGLRVKAWLAQATVFQMLRDHLGLRHVERCYTGGAALGPDVFRFYHALGVNLKQVYGQTESSGLSAIHHDGDIKFQTVGPPLPGTEVKIADSGEILVKNTAVFHGYYKNPEATQEALWDGWLHTGDAGYFDESGHLIVIDRAKDVMSLPDGTKFSPQFIENKLKFSPYIREAVVFGGDYPFVTAMINIDFGSVGKWAENNRLGYTTYTDLAQKPEVYELVRRDVERTNADLPPSARIRRFLLLHKELDADDAELTRTRKVRRRFVTHRYSHIVEALYGDADFLAVETAITYQDGSTATIQTRLRVAEVDGSGNGKW